MKTKRIIAFFLVLLMTVTLASCGDKTENPDATTESQTESAPESTNPYGGFPLLVDGRSGYRFIISDKAEIGATRALSSVYTTLVKAYPTAGFKLKSDNLAPGSKPDEKEILIGLTSREGAEEFRGSIPKDCFVIEVTDTTLKIDGSGDAQVRLALEYFEKNYLTPNENGDIILPVGKYVSEPYAPTVAEYVSKEPGLITSSVAVKNVNAIDGKKGMQGGCTDGTYLYVCMVNSGDSQSAYVHKIEIATMKTVKVSGELKTDHSNDATYVPSTNEIYICHNAPNRTKVTVIDADTLEFKKTLTIPFNIFSIAYQAERDVFVLGLSGGQDFTVVDRNFVVDKNYLPSVNRFTANNTGYTTQGVECDKDYIYFVQYKQNVIMIYDWEGKFINKVSLDLVGVEPENLSIVGDKIYISCNNSNFTGGVIYASQLVKSK